MATQGSPLRIFLLGGPLLVELPDGSHVECSAWRTRKTADLLTMLALCAGEAVPVPRLLEGLWPEVDEAKGRASLRTAASTLRRMLGPDSLSRELHGISLIGAEVDAAHFEDLAEQTRDALAAHNYADAVETAVAAAALYRRDLAPFDGDSSWASDERDRLRRLLTEVLADGAEAAIGAARHREAVTFATRLLDLNPFDERAYRGAMIGYAGLGELERAVQMFMTCKTALAEELGLDPSPQTRVAYLQVLRAGQEEAGTVPMPSPEDSPISTLLRRASESFGGRRIREGNDLIRSARRASLSPAARAATNLVVAEHAVLLGEAPRVLDLASAALTDLGAGEAPPLATGLNTAGLLLLAAHDLGAERPSSSLHNPSVPTWLALRILVERGDVEEATELAAARPSASSHSAETPLATVLDGMARAAVLLASNDLEGSKEILRATLDYAVTEDTASLLPELAARLAAAEADEDLESAIERLDLAELALGEGVYARERCAMLLARAAIRAAAGGTDAAVSGADSAARTAASLGLVHLVTEAEQWIARLSRAPAASIPRPRREVHQKAESTTVH